MANQCFICATQFSFLKKEYGCANCGHSVCKKCRSKQAVVPKLGTAPQNVCTKCYDQLTNPKSSKQNVENAAKYSPPANFKKRLEKQAALEASGNAVSQRDAHVPKSRPKKCKGLSPKDKEIAQRLEKLKEERIKERGPIPSVEEMEERLAKLKDLDPEVMKQPTKPVYQPPVQKSFADQYEELFSEIAEEVALDAKIHGNQQEEIEDSLQKDELHNTVINSKSASGEEVPVSQAAQVAGSGEDGKKVTEEDIRKLIEEAKQEIKTEEGQKAIEQEVEERLARLRRNSQSDIKQDTETGPGETVGASAASNVEDGQISEEEAANRRLIRSILAEDALDERVKSQGYGDLLERAVRRASSIQEQYPVDPDELPWCSICNNDAVLRCYGCERDLFCKRCYSFGHDKYDQHETRPYPPAETQTCDS
ncbi:abscission/NoCut checkpoint regulator-like [Ptychodera flava]|uniref:abscission/NoCut checkpoint regulator-like n=1 Tax=Ptychodera flava TaxID=63121 RepID=UPI00396A9ECD